MAEFPRITRQPHVVGGRACLRDSGVTVSTIIALAATGRPLDEITRIFPMLNGDDVREALAYAAWLIDEKEVNFPVKSQPSTLFGRNRRVEKSGFVKSFNGGLHVGNGLEIPSPSEAEPQSPEMTVEAPEEEKTQDAEESLELYHPSYPDEPTVIVTRDGLFDRRWCMSVIDWGDIRELKYTSGEKTITVHLRNPQPYLASMPLLRRVTTEVKFALNLGSFQLDTASLGVRTKDLYHMINRLWVLNNGRLLFRKKHRIKAPGKKTGRTAQDELWNSLMPPV